MVAEYDAIADEYRDSKQLPFRLFIERYTLFKILGDINGSRVLDMACGDGFYTRLLKRAGAATVTGIDISAEMIRLAKQAEAESPLGCTYLQQDVARFEAQATVDVVVAAYLLNYARTAEQLLRLCRVCYDCLRPGGRFVGFNDNIRNPPKGIVSWEEYGLEKSCRPDPAEGDVIRYRITNSDGKQFKFNNFYLSPQTYRNAFHDAGFREFRWHDVSVHPAEWSNSLWDRFVADPPVIPFSAIR